MAEREPLAGLRVVDFSNLLSGVQASQLMADHGADVIHIEPPGGSPLRCQAGWPFWGRGKRSIELDLKTADDLAVARGLARGADVVIETWRPGVADRLGLGYAALSTDNPGLVYGSVSGFGARGPFSGLQGYEGIVMAKVGAYWALEGMARRPGPAFASAPYCSYPAAQLLAQAIMGALYDREDTGLGQHVETSLAQGLTVNDTFNWFARVLAQRYQEGFKQKARVVGGVPTGGLSFRLLIAITKDGKWLQFSQTADRLFKAMMKMLELDWMFQDQKWATAPDFDDEAQRLEFWEILLNKVRSKTHAEWLETFEKHPNVWGEEFRKNSEILDHPQMQWNQMVAEYQDRDVGRLRSPAAVIRVDRAPAKLGRPSPRRGEHDASIRTEAAAAAPPRIAAKAAPTGKAPLEGVTVVELATYFAAPYGVTLMAEMGARVIKLEQTDGDPHRHMLPFPEIAGLKVLQGKESVAIDLTKPKGREIAYQIIEKADVVMQAFRAGVAEKQGLDASTLQSRFPTLIYHASPGYGESGPYGRRPAFAPTIGAAAGLAHRNIGSAIPDGPGLDLEVIKPSSLQLATAVMGVGNSDGLSSVTSGTAIMLGLLARKRGAGAHKTFTSMISSTAHALSEVMVEYEGRPPVMMADPEAHGFHALYRLYPAGDGEWVFLAAPSQREWTRLTAALPDGVALAADRRFSIPEVRKAHDGELAAALTAIFASRPAGDWEREMRAADVACVEVARGPVEANYMDKGSVGDQQDMNTTARHPILESVPRLKPLWRFSRSATRAGDAGLVGQETEKVMKELGYTDQEIAALADEGVILLG